MARPSMRSTLEFYGVRYRDGRREQKVCCPIHGDHDPSMNVNLDEGVVFCHACGFGGNALQLIMAMEELDKDAATTFAADQGIETVDEPGGGEQVLGGYLSGRRVARKPRDKRRDRRVLPAWGGY